MEMENEITCSFLAARMAYEHFYQTEMPEKMTYQTALALAVKFAGREKFFAFLKEKDIK